MKAFGVRIVVELIAPIAISVLQLSDELPLCHAQIFRTLLVVLVLLLLVASPLQLSLLLAPTIFILVVPSKDLRSPPH
jgi:hypothetical protein